MRELSAEEVEQVSGGYLDGYTAAGLIMGTLSLGAATGPLAPVVWSFGAGAAGGLFIAQTMAHWNIGTGGGYAAPPGGAGVSSAPAAAGAEGGGSD